MDVALGVIEVGRTVGCLAGVEHHVAAVERGCAHLNGCAFFGTQTVNQRHALYLLQRLGIAVNPRIFLFRHFLVGIAETLLGVHQEKLATFTLLERTVLANASRRTTCLHHHAIGRSYLAVLGVNEDLRMLDLNTCHVLAVLDALHAGKVGGAAHFAPFRAFRKREPLAKTLFNVLDRNVLSTQLLEELSIVPCLQ